GWVAAEVVAVVAVGDSAAGGRCARGRACVLVLASRGVGRASGREGVAHRQGAVWAGEADGLVVADTDVGQGHVAVVGDEVGPGDGAAHGDEGTGVAVGVLAVGGLLDVDAWIAAEVVAGVAVGDGAAGGRCARGRACVLVLASR